MTLVSDSPPPAGPATEKPDINREMSAENLAGDASHADNGVKMFIRLRKQRAERERAKRQALRKQKTDARATLQNARESLRASEEEVRRCEARLDDLNQTKSQLSNSLKSITAKEAERKRQREAAAAKAAEEARRAEKQRVQAQQHAALAQLIGLDALLQQQQQQQQQIKNTELLNALNAMNNGAVSRQLGFSSPTSSIAISSASPHPGRFSPATPAGLTQQQQQQQQQNLFAQLAAVGLSATAGGPSLTDQFQQQQPTTANFLRQYAGGAPFNAAPLVAAPGGSASDASTAMLRAVSQTLDALQQPAGTSVNLGAQAAARPPSNLSILQQQQQQTNRRVPTSSLVPPAASLPPSAGPTAGAGAFNASEALTQLAAAGGVALPNDLMYQALLANFGLQPGAAK